LGREVTLCIFWTRRPRRPTKARAEQPEVEAAVRMTIGKTYDTLVLCAAAESRIP